MKGQFNRNIKSIQINWGEKFIKLTTYLKNNSVSLDLHILVFKACIIPTKRLSEIIGLIIHLKPKLLAKK